jgi:hypothetical protein
MTSTDKRCGAKNRQGNPCALRPMKDKTRCKLHGGATPKGTKGNRSHGLYSAALSQEEKDLWADVQLGNVDDEIRLCKIKVRRAELAQAAVQIDPVSMNNTSGFELSEIRKSETDTQTVTKRPDYAGIIDRLLGRIGQLEKTRAELIAAAGSDAEESQPLPWID